VNWLDIVLLVLLAIAAFLGLRIGLIKAALSLAGLIVGVILAGSYYGSLAQHLGFIPGDGVAEVVAFIIILLVVLMIALALALLLKWATSAIMLGWVDRLGGAIFGLLWGAILYGALLAMWLKYVGEAEAITESTVASILVKSFPLVLALLPQELDAVRSFFQ
jgi:membrane protein required for colicin V production